MSMTLCKTVAPALLHTTTTLYRNKCLDVDGDIFLEILDEEDDDRLSNTEHFSWIARTLDERCSVGEKKIRY